MAGFFSITNTETTSDAASFSQCMPLTTVNEQFEVEYAQFVNYPPLQSLISTHHSLIPHSAYFRKRFRGGGGGAWLKSTESGVFVKLLPKTSTGSGDAILMVYHRYKLLEEHYVSRLHFSWPQVTCISGFPARGTRAIVLSYKDGRNSDQIQKFAFRFSATHEAEKFISALKESMEDTRPEVSNAKFGSAVSSQQEFDPSDCPSYKSIDESWRSGLSLDASSHYIPTTTDHEAAQASNGQGLILNNSAEEILSTFPPSFTSFLMNCCPTADQGAAKQTKSEDADFKDQLMKYMKDPSFQDTLAKAEQLITELGDDIHFP